MPREIVILAPRLVTLEDVIRGAREVDSNLFIRVIAHGAFTQLLTEVGELGNAVCESIARYVGGTCVVQDNTYRDVP